MLSFCIIFKSAVYTDNPSEFCYAKPTTPLPFATQNPPPFAQGRLWKETAAPAGGGLKSHSLSFNRGYIDKDITDITNRHFPFSAKFDKINPYEKQHRF